MKENRKITNSREDEEGMIRQIKLMKLGKYSQIAAIASIIFMFFLSWVSLFDLFNLDTDIEKWTLAAAAGASNRPFNPDIRILTIQDNSFDKAWRKKKMPELVKKLSEAGAKAIILDIAFEGSTPFDNSFADSIKRARENGSHVVVGIANKDRDGPILSEPLKRSVSGIGIACIGRKRQRARTVPIAVLGKGSGGERKATKAPLFSLPLAAYTAFKDLKFQFIDLEEKYVRLLAPDGTAEKLKFTELTKVGDNQDCSLLSIGDMVADVIIEPYPVAVLREKNRSFFYREAIRFNRSKAEAAFKGRVVLVGVTVDDRFEEKRGFKTEVWYGVELQAEALNTLLNGVTLRPMGETGQVLFMICLGMSGAFIRSRKSRMKSWIRIPVVLLVHGGYLAGAILICSLYGLLLNSVYHIGAFWLSWWVTARLEKRIIQRIFN